jgi:thiamine biosynthesis lipoprotein
MSNLKAAAGTSWENGGRGAGGGMLDVEFLDGVVEQQPARMRVAARSSGRVEERHRGMRRRGIEAGILLVVFIAWLGGCAAREGRLERFEFTRLEMGVKTRVVTYAASQEEAERGAQAAFARVAELDACMSDYRADSELMWLCGNGGPAPVSKDLFIVLMAAQHVSQATCGAFDVSVGPAVALWRKARAEHRLPYPVRVHEAAEQIGWQKIELNPERMTVTLHGLWMRLDLGGIAKGYAAQQAVEVLKKNGQAHCLVALAGDICAGEAPPGEEGWKIEVAPPPESPFQVRLRTLVLANACVSTSGDREQFVEIEGKRYSHIIDPRTAMALTNHAQATVVGRDGAVVDAAATALCVLGASRTAEVSEKLGVSCVVFEGREETVCDQAGMLSTATRSMPARR